MKSRLWFLFRWTSISGLRRRRRRHRLEAETRSSRSGGCCVEWCWWPEKRQKWWIWAVTSSSSSRLKTNESNYMVRLRRLGQTFGGSIKWLSKVRPKAKFLLATIQQFTRQQLHKHEWKQQGHDKEFISLRMTGQAWHTGVYKASSL